MQRRDIDNAVRRGANDTTRSATDDAPRVGADSLPRRFEELPFGWMILWLLLALSLYPSLAKAERSGAKTTIAASAPQRVMASTAAVTPVVEAVDAIGITVSDMDASVEFYSKVLSFEKVSDIEVAGANFEHLEGVFGLRMRVVRMRLGGKFIELTEYLAPKGRPVPIDSRSNDRWFQHIAIITSDMDRAYDWLRQHKIQHASTGPQRIPDWNKAAAGIRAFYFKDPDNHVLEILSFPPDKGALKWHQPLVPAGRLFLGIDHTAIVVSDTEASLRFYRDTLGMQIGGTSENYGTEQEHLNNVFGAHLRITSLHAAAGPSIEFLEYLAPRDGRPIPADERANDIAHWQTSLVTRDATRGVEGFREKYNFVSSGLVKLMESVLGFNKGLLVRDPDGHVMKLIER
ncbi:MAG TPA: VOC family protein [Pyrinomonadaceae bacterium]